MPSFPGIFLCYLSDLTAYHRPAGVALIDGMKYGKHIVESAPHVRFQEVLLVGDPVAQMRQAFELFPDILSRSVITGDVRKRCVQAILPQNLRIWSVNRQRLAEKIRPVTQGKLGDDVVVVHGSVLAGMSPSAASRLFTRPFPGLGHGPV